MNNKIETTSKHSLKELLDKFINLFISNNYNIWSEVGTVKEVNINNSYCDIIFNDKREARCWMQANTKKGVLLIPKISSSVIVTWMSKSNAIITGYGEVDTFYLFYNVSDKKSVMKAMAEQVTFFEGDKGGLINIGELMDYLTKIKADLDMIRGHFSDGYPTGLITPQGAVTGRLGINVPIQTPAPVRNKFEDTKVKH